jgi:MSHA biogenesis protein MshM
MDEWIVWSLKTKVMYEEYFGLNRPPFKITPDTSLFFGGGKRGDILGALVYAVHRGEGIVKVVGEVGSGKTMLCRMLQQELPKSVEIIYIANPSVSAEDILFVMAHELELPIPNQTVKQISKHEVMRMLQDYLVQRHMENKQVVLFIEEAQGMPLDTLEEIRLLSNLETDQNKLLQIILFGQPELDENLALKSIRQLRERITHTFQLSPLSAEEIHLYLNFRMREVGYTGPELITKDIAKKIQRYSGGLLRRINIIADKVLLSAFAESTHNLTTKHVMAAVNDSGFKPEKSNKPNGWLVTALVVTILLGLGLYQFGAHWLALVLPQSVAQAKNSNEIVALVTDPLQDLTDNAVKIEMPKATEPNTAELKAEVVEITNAPIAIIVSPAEAVLPAGNGNSVKNSSETPSEVVELDRTFATNTIKSIQKSDDAQAVVPVNLAESTMVNSDLTEDYNQWLNNKIEASRAWLVNAGKDNVSIQVMMRNKAAARELVRFLKNDWPLDLNRTYLYEVRSGSRSIYRVFYREFDSMAKGQREIKQLPESVRVNGPYLHSIYKMQAALLN